MSRRISPVGAAALVACSAIAVVLFLYLAARFGGPTLRFSSPYEVRVALPDAKELAVRSDVLDLGVKVGQIEQIDLRGGRAIVTFSLQPRYAPLHADATVRVAEKTLLGEAFLDLGAGRSGVRTLKSGSMLPATQVLPASVEIDQALNALDPPTVGHLKHALRTFAAGAGSADAAGQVSRTLAALPELTDELRRLFQVLHGQEGDLAAGVTDGRVVLTQLGEREHQVAEIVSGGRATLQALAARARALAAGMHELPALMTVARRTLRDARPLLLDARPLLGELRTAAPSLAGALRELPPVAGEARDVISRLPSFNARVIPLLAAARAALSIADAPAVALGPALRNLVAIMRYLSPRANTFAAWFSNTAGIGASRDAKGHFVRFSIFVEPGTASATSGGGFENNPYTQPNDAANNRPYSGYPRLTAFAPGLPRR